MSIGVVLYVVPRDGFDDVPAAAGPEGASLVAHDGEGGADAIAGEQVGDGQEGVVGFRGDEVLGVEGEDELGHGLLSPGHGVADMVCRRGRKCQWHRGMA